MTRAPAHPGPRGAETGGLIVGANLPWIHYGGDFGANAWHPEGGVGSTARRVTMEEHLRRIAREGVRHLRWFLLCDGRAGLAKRDGGDVSLDGHVLRDMDAAVEMATALDLRILFVLLDFKWFERGRVVDGVLTGGRRQLVACGSQRERFLENVVEPMLRRFGRAAAVWGWDVVNEPEWILRDWRRPLGASRRVIRHLVGGVVVRARELCPEQVVTVGLASSAGLELVRGLGLTLYQWHWYDGVEAQGSIETPVASFGLDAPALLGEFPTNGATKEPREILRLARAGGYAGALSWSALLDDADSSSQVALNLGELPGYRKGEANA